MRRWVLAAGILVILVAPTAARAAKVQVAVYDLREPSSKYLSYSAAPGEQNRVRVNLISTKKLIFRVVDEGANLTTGPGCTAVSDHEATCRGPGFAQMTTGDLNDVVHVQHLSSEINGGPGDDALITADGFDSLNGGGGNDTLRAGAKDDRLTDGDNPITGVGPDIIDGGAGHDRVDYQRREAPVSVDVRGKGPQGEPGEGDTIVGIEDAIATSTADRLIGDNGPNSLQSFGTHGVVRGRGGDDQLEADWDGRDVVSGGPGNDYLRLSPTLGGDAPPAPDAISCGSGRDLVSFPTEEQFVPLDCEVVDYDSFYDPLYALRGRLATTTSQIVKIVPNSCPKWAVHNGRCRLTWAIREKAPSGGTRGPLLARRVEVFAKNADGPSVVLRLTRAGRRILRRRHGLDARIGNLDGRGMREGFVMRLQLAAKP
jgi:hypothetical protein